MSSAPFASMRAAYEGIESVFADRAELERYRRMALEKTAEQAGFIAAQKAGPNAVEIAAGNGRLLMALRIDGVIERGLGVELAESRVDFARAWAADAPVEGLEFVAGDALQQPLEGNFDMALCITGAFGYFDAHARGAGARLLAKLSAALRPGGLVVLELYPHPAAIRLIEAAGGRLRAWDELPSDDPWRFYLSELWLEDNVLAHRKTFVHRTERTIDEGRSERVAIYAPDELTEMLVAAGFIDVRLFEGWSDAPYQGGEVMVALAARA